MPRHRPAAAPRPTRRPAASSAEFPLPLARNPASPPSPPGGFVGCGRRLPARPPLPLTPPDVPPPTRQEASSCLGRGKCFGACNPAPQSKLVAPNGRGHLDVCLRTRDVQGPRLVGVGAGVTSRSWVGVFKGRKC